MSAEKYRDKCYAFHCSELLLEHLKEVYECMERNPITLRIARKYTYLTRTDPSKWQNLYAKLIALSGLLHDVGKVLSCYQRQKCEEEGGKVRYIGHETVPFALIVSSIVKKYGKDVIENASTLLREGVQQESWVEPFSVLVLVALPILAHHYAQRDDILDQAIQGVNSCEDMTLYKPCADVIKSVEEEISLFAATSKTLIGSTSTIDGPISVIVDALKLIQERQLKGLISAVMNDERIRNLTDVVLKHTQADCMYCDMVLAVTGILNACDGRVAARVRASGKMREARDELCVVIELWSR